MSDLLIVGATKAEAGTLKASLATVLAKGTADVWDLDGKQGAAAAAGIAATSPAVVAIGSALGTDDRLSLARAIEQADPLVTTIMIVEPDVAILRKALEAGVREIIDVGADQRHAADALKRAFEAGALRRSSFDERVTERLGRKVITVISAKGGSGKTVISSNIAAALAKKHPKEVVLVDLDLQFGDSATSLLLAPIHTLSDAANVPADALDAATLKVFLTRHAPSELYVLCAPDDPALGDAIRPEAIGRILDALATEFRFVVIDTDAGLNEQTLAAMERSTDFVVVVDLDVPSVRGGRKLLRTLDSLGLGAAQRHIVLNRADSKVGLDISEVSEVLGAPIDIALPSTRQVPVAFNEGRPLVVDYARTPIAKQIVALTERFEESRGRANR